VSRRTDLPLVSVVVPVFDGERFLIDSLNSILEQTYPQFEVIVMDDASSDETSEIISSYGSRIQSHRQRKTRGIYGSANDGIALARGEYIAIYHSDDIYDRRIVEREVSFLEKYPEAVSTTTLVSLRSRHEFSVALHLNLVMGYSVLVVSSLGVLFSNSEAWDFISALMKIGVYVLFLASLLPFLSRQERSSLISLWQRYRVGNTAG